MSIRSPIYLPLSIVYSSTEVSVAAPEEATSCRRIGRRVTCSMYGENTMGFLPLHVGCRSVNLDLTRVSGSRQKAVARIQYPSLQENISLTYFRHYKRSDIGMPRSTLSYSDLISSTILAISSPFLLLYRCTASSRAMTQLLYIPPRRSSSISDNSLA